MPSAAVPEQAKQAHDTRDPHWWGWVEPTVWTERCLEELAADLGRCAAVCEMAAGLIDPELGDGVVQRRAATAAPRPRPGPSSHPAQLSERRVQVDDVPEHDRVRLPAEVWPAGSRHAVG
jgi:hypothetical protein